MSIGTFLADENFGSWADEMEDMPLPSTSESRSTFGGERRTVSSTAGFGNGYNDRERPAFARPDLPLPTEPPYTAHIGNLSFDATSEDVSQLFADCEVTNVRIVEDKLNRTPKGFGYVEFASVEGLKKALTFSGTSLQGRGIRVSIAEPPKESQQSRDFSDWTRKGPLPDLPRRGNDRPARDFPDNISDGGSVRGERRRFEGDGKPRDFGNWERKGPLSPVSAAAVGREGGRPRNTEGSGFRKNSPAWGEGRSQDGSRPPRREFQERPERPERTPTAADLDNQWRARMRPDPAPKEPSAPSSPVAATPTPAAPAPAVRPKLNLQKRTVSENVQSPPPSAGGAGDSKASPFGAARPIDTAAREREVAEKRDRARKEAEDKTKSEKAEKRQSKEKTKSEKAADGDANGAKETDPDVPKKSNFEVLRRADEDGSGMAADEEETEAAEESTATKDATKEAPSGKANGSWRKAEPAANEADDEGWSTVSTGKRNKGRGRGY
ncbi:hypothetical protein BGW36DRAFT_421823 [Talaromyces proteolyticus]|uniref:RRM domain-containing protein n=1 Tax=Talaromyces proteolyticus TaxID=1131652 RepID=A0AAD4L786_9EURO|nr:uncharacterized protein BGW36DRAFT_421823 [Talaromyces proteolyticus]KAH8705259.1 hypothetical protein BGW36DRAFT_421823 [Talaromyces proteolyticus]